MKEEDYKATARSRLTDRHRSDETFLAILDTLVEIKSQRQQQYLNIADTFLDIDKSEGKNLDLIGKLIGEERTLVNFIDRAYFGFLGARLSESYDIGYWYSLYKNKYGTLRTLTDEEYRRVLKARVVKNSSGNGRNSLIEVLNILSGNSNSSITESYNNTAITVNVEDTDGLVSYYLSKYKSDKNLIPVPLGRRLNINHVTSSGDGGGNEMHFTTTTGTIDYYGVTGDQIVLNNGNTITLETDSMYGITVPSGKHKLVLVEPRSHDYVGLGGEALVEIHNFPTLCSINTFDTCPNDSSPNLVKVPTTLPYNITNIQYMFSGATSFNQDISMWDTSHVILMYRTFSGASAFNQDISGWNTGSVTQMHKMFENATSFNQPIGNWNTSAVTIMDSMFNGATSFNQDLSQWCVSHIAGLPSGFDTNTPSWTLPKPVWGTCPT